MWKGEAIIVNDRTGSALCWNPLRSASLRARGGRARAEAVTVSISAAELRSQCSRCPHGHGWRPAGRGAEGAAVAGSIRPAGLPEALAPPQAGGVRAKAAIAPAAVVRLRAGAEGAEG